MSVFYFLGGREMDYKQLFAERLAESIEHVLAVEEIEKVIEKPRKKNLGDFAFPCFALAKHWKKAPNMIATELAPKIEDRLFQKVEAVGPYINIFLHKQLASKQILDRVLQLGSHYGSNTDGQGGAVTIDLSSPNIAKAFSMGHLRSTVIGNAIAHIAEKNGYRPIRINHLGDWGTQFGKLIVAYRKWGSEEEVRKNPISELMKLYLRFHEEATDDPSLEAAGREAFKRLENGDADNHALWEWFREESLQEFSRIYDLLGVKFDYFTGEAFYTDKMDAVVDMLEEKQLLVESDGAKVVSLEENNLPPCLIQKSDGATLYATRDLATALYRKAKYDFAKSLYVVGSEQSLHFTQLKLVLQKAGFNWSQDMEHVSFGMMLRDGKKMSTRKGHVVLLEEVLVNAIERTQEIIKEKNPTLEEKEKVSHDVGIGAVIFHDLKHFRTNDVEFSMEQMLNFEGETGPYLQYTHARCHSLLRKGGYTPHTEALEVADEEAWSILTLLKDFDQVVKLAWREYDPSKIARYALDLARSLNQYYAHVHILSDEQNKIARMNLIYATATVLKEALRILGLQAPQEM
jgi:arginyl-tRNA synthetase